MFVIRLWKLCHVDYCSSGIPFIPPLSRSCILHMRRCTGQYTLSVKGTVSKDYSDHGLIDQILRPPDSS